jgi:hypothetical protein
MIQPDSEASYEQNVRYALADVGLKDVRVSRSMHG